eukprot:4586693-Ditylum_brightwellii.AAC.1
MWRSQDPVLNPVYLWADTVNCPCHPWEQRLLDSWNHPGRSPSMLYHISRGRMHHQSSSPSHRL